MNKATESLWMALTALMAAIIQGCINSVVPVLIAMAVFVFTTSVDFITGVEASRKEGKEFESSRARKCFYKWFIYLGVFVGTAFLGVLLTILSKFTHGDACDMHGFFLNILRWEVWIAAVIESLSIVENLHRWFPDNIWIAIIYDIFSIQVFQKLPELKQYFQDKKKNNNQDSTAEQTDNPDNTNNQNIGQ
jgi:hypothetical protein